MNFFSNIKFSHLSAQNTWQNLLNVTDENDVIPFNTGNQVMNNEDLMNLVSRILLYVAGALIFVFVFVIAYGAFTWIKAGDNEESIKKAKKIYTNGIIGLLISLTFGIFIVIFAQIIGVQNVSNLWQVNIFS